MSEFTDRTDTTHDELSQKERLAWLKVFFITHTGSPNAMLQTLANVESGGRMSDYLEQIALEQHRAGVTPAGYLAREKGLSPDQIVFSGFVKADGTQIVVS